MTGRDYLDAFLEAIAVDAVFWLLLAAALGFVIVCSLCLFDRPKRWLRALISAALAVECVVFILAGGAR